MELLRTIARVDISRMKPRGESQFIMLNPLDARVSCVTIRIEDPKNFLNLKNGETVTVVVTKDQGTSQ